MHALIEALDTYGIENVWRRYFLAVPLEQKFEWQGVIMFGLLMLLFARFWGASCDRPDTLTTSVSISFLAAVARIAYS